MVAASPVSAASLRCSTIHPAPVPPLVLHSDRIQFQNLTFQGTKRRKKRNGTKKEASQQLDSVLMELLYLINIHTQFYWTKKTYLCRPFFPPRNATFAANI